MRRRPARQAVLMGALLAMLGWTTPTALAAPSAGPPQWAITSVAAPAHFKPGDKGDLYVVTATNVGGAATNGETITIEDSLHGEAEATQAVGTQTPGFGIYGDAFTGSPLSCALSPPSSVKCTYGKTVDVGTYGDGASRILAYELPAVRSG